MPSNKIRITHSSGNVFVDLECTDPVNQLLKAALVARIDGIIRQLGLKQVEAGELLGLSQPDVARLMSGDFREYSVERLLRFLLTLGRDIEIIIREPDIQRHVRLGIET